MTTLIPSFEWASVRPTQRCRERARGPLLAMISLVAAAGATGCSTFDRDWEKVTRDTAPAETLCGRWQGHWISDLNSHTGQLRAIIVREGCNKAPRYLARFKAWYGGSLTFEYTVELEKGRQEGHARHFIGEADLGWLAGGIYRYEGKADTRTFSATYESKYDYGRFEMKREGGQRPATCCAP